MRLPVFKLYRAFPELDRFSDAECERYVLQVRVQRHVGPKAYGIGIAAAALGVLASIFVGPLVFSRGEHEWWLLPAALAVLVGPACLGLFSGMIARDRLLRRGLRLRIGSARCTNCRHSLLGLPLLKGMEPAVRCPECGSVMRLAELGLTPADLMPRHAHPDEVAEIKPS